MIGVFSMSRQCLSCVGCLSVPVFVYGKEEKEEEQEEARAD